MLAIVFAFCGVTNANPPSENDWWEALDRYCGEWLIVDEKTKEPSGYFEKHLPDSEITIYDAPTIPALGVGESCLPQLKWWWEEQGIDEKDWESECNAVLKYGNYKEGWNAPEFDKPFVTRFWFNDNNKFDQMMADPQMWEYKPGQDKRPNKKKFCYWYTRNKVK